MAPIVIYHGNCADGFTAAWVVRKYFLEKLNVKEDSEEFPVFYPGTYGKPVPVDVTGHNVIMVDFSYKRMEMMGICTNAKSVIVIDHHKTAEQELSGLDTLYKNTDLYFDMEHSGAMLAWMYYFNDAIPPDALKHVEDRDLWRFKIFGTREFNSTMFSYPYTWQNWDKLMYEPTDQAIREGAAIDRKHLKDIEELLLVVTRKMKFAVPLDVADGHELDGILADIIIPVANVPYTLGSDAANILAKREMEEGRPGVAGYYYDTPEGRVFGFRSIGDYDCSLIAKVLGGGGHRNASGSNRIPVSIYQGFEVGLVIKPTDGSAPYIKMPHADN